MTQPHGNPYPSSGQQPQPPAYQPMPPQGSYQGPWPSQLPSGTFPGMPVVGLQRPVSLTVAFWLMVAYGVLPLLSIPFIIQWAEAYMRDSIAMAAAESGRAVPPGFMQQFTSMMTPMAWVSGIIGAGIAVLLGLGLRAGMNWVRILLTVWAGLSLLSTVGSFALMAALGLPAQLMFPLPAGAYAVSFATVALFLAAVVVSWLPSSSRYVAARRAAKLGGGYLR
ncbi:hypothetical protein [Sinomonas atrocyanea]|uniref:hypothetical protein n=1 Tax=Sinomonas atrocyanea TaxID=37927 RepID=UPI003D98D6DD